MLSIGLMSGTSMDGIDAALLETDGTPDSLVELGHIYLPYDKEFTLLLKAAERAVKQRQGDFNKAAGDFPHAVHEYLQESLQLSENAIEAEISSMTHYLYGACSEKQMINLHDIVEHTTSLRANAVRQLLSKSGFQLDDIDVVGFHGQTLYHRPDEKCSVIVGDGPALADELGVQVVNDFRRADVEAGGQGAPFAPLYHLALAIRDNKVPSVVVNCGGIANITVIPTRNENDLIAFDTGPGNALIDSFVRQRTEGREHMDADGKHGLYGEVHYDVLDELIEKSIQHSSPDYFKLAPPKSLDYGDMQLIPELENLSMEDACATLAAFTAETIVASLDLIRGEIPKRWVLAGGGWHNPVIREALLQRLYPTLGVDVDIVSADEIGWCNQALEAQIFAYLAVRSSNDMPLSLPNTTGVPEPMTGGKVHVPA